VSGFGVTVRDKLRWPRPAALACAAERLAPALILLAGVFAAAFTAAKLYDAIEQGGLFAFDFRGTTWVPADAVLHGRNPYPAPHVAALLKAGHPAVYPPAILLVALPFALIPVVAAAVVWDLLMAACLFAALRIVGVCDRRVFAVVLFSFPFVGSMLLGQIEGLLALGCALAWRYRNRASVCGLVVAAVVAAKLFLWPLIVWLLVTGRRTAAAVSAAAAAALVVGSWAVIGFAGLGSYPRLLAALARAYAGRGYSPVAVLLRTGLPYDIARLVAPAVTLVALTAVVLLAREGETGRAFAAAVAAGIFGSPIVWMHYLVLLVVPIALSRPRFGAVWFVPLAYWGLSGQENKGSAWNIVGMLAVTAIALALAMRPERERARAPVLASP